MYCLESDEGLTCLHLRYPEIKIKEGCCTFFTGKSGCGKSTYLKLLNATMQPTLHELRYYGENIQTLDAITYRRNVMLVPQDVFLFDSSIEENFQRYYQCREEPMLSIEQIKEFLRICCMDSDVSTSCTTLSGGEKQRVFLAIFLSFHPNVLLLDEPTSALDSATANQLLDQLTTYCKTHQITMVAITHQEALALRYGDEIIRLGEAQ